MTSNIDSPTNCATWVSLGVPHRPELLERRGTINRGLVVPPGREDVVASAIACNGPLALCCGSWVVRSVRLDDVVLDQCISSPAINGKVAVAVGLVGSVVVDDSNW